MIELTYDDLFKAKFWKKLLIESKGNDRSSKHLDMEWAGLPMIEQIRRHIWAAIASEDFNCDS